MQHKNELTWLSQQNNATLSVAWTSSFVLTSAHFHNYVHGASLTDPIFCVYHIGRSPLLPIFKSWQPKVVTNGQSRSVDLHTFHCFFLFQCSFAVGGQRERNQENISVSFGEKDVQSITSSSFGDPKMKKKLEEKKQQRKNMFLTQCIWFCSWNMLIMLPTTRQQERNCQ